MPETLYKVGDFVSYLGDQSVQSEPLRSPDIARIDQIRNNGVEDRMSVFLLANQTAIECGYDLIRPLSTTVVHLQKLGFSPVANQVGGPVKYQSGRIVVSSMGYEIPHRYVFLSGFCLGDFSTITDFKKYLNDGEIDKAKLFADFPKVENVNDLFRELRKIGWVIKEGAILL